MRRFLPLTFAATLAATAHAAGEPAATKPKPPAVEIQKDGKIRINPTSPPSPTAEPPLQPDSKKQPHIVFIAGDHEYRSETILPMLARILQRDHGFKATMSYAVNERGQIDPDNDALQTDLGALKEADIAVLFVRWRKWPPETVRHLLEFAETGKPIVGFRTAHHGFQYANELGRELPESETPLGLASLGDMNQPWTIRVFGQIFQGHNGPNSNTRVTVFEGAEHHPVLLGVKPFTARSWMYRVSPKGWNGTEKFLLRGQSYDFNYGKIPDPKPFNDPMPVAWLREYETTTGKRATTFFTSLGHPEEWMDESMRKLALNAILHLLDREVPPGGARADFAEPFEPGEVGVGPKYFKTGQKPRDLSIPPAKEATWSPPPKPAPAGKGLPAGPTEP